MEEGDRGQTEVHREFVAVKEVMRVGEEGLAQKDGGGGVDLGTATILTNASSLLHGREYHRILQEPGLPRSATCTPSIISGLIPCVPLSRRLRWARCSSNAPNLHLLTCPTSILTRQDMEARKLTREKAWEVSGWADTVKQVSVFVDRRVCGSGGRLTGRAPVCFLNDRRSS